MECIFCEIVKGNIPAYKVWENERALAFLDIHPINPGHVLVIPKIHEPHLHRLEVLDYAAVMEGVKKMAEKIEKELQPKRVGMAVIGWDVPHTHVHVVPMNDTHDITSKKFIEHAESNPSKEELATIHQQIKL